MEVSLSFALFSYLSLKIPAGRAVRLTLTQDKKLTKVLFFRVLKCFSLLMFQLFQDKLKTEGQTI